MNKENFFIKMPENTDIHKNDSTPENADMVISNAEKQARYELANELNKSSNGSYVKTLQKFIAGCALAGITFGQTSEAVAPVLSQEKLMSDSLTSLKYEGDNAEQKMKIIIKAITEKGGVKESDQLDILERPYHLSDEVFQSQRDIENPYYLKPGVIFGEGFIKENPEMATAYYEKVSKAIRSTVFIESSSGIGSGVIIDTKKGMKMLTNAHVIRDDSSVYIELGGQKIAGTAEIIESDSAMDIALLEITELGNIEKNKEGVFELLTPIQMKSKEELASYLEENSVEALEVMSNEEFDEINANVSIASIGNTSGYPFSTMLLKAAFFSENIGYKTDFEGEKNTQDTDLLYTQPDERFTGRIMSGSFPFVDLLDDENKSHARIDAMNSRHGASGGPAINLDSNTESKLLGINVAILSGIELTDKPNNRNSIYSGLITAKSINEFLKNRGY